MNTNTNIKPIERRGYDRRATDRTKSAQAKEPARCAEAGCRENVWPGSEFCIWHPTLQMAGGMSTRERDS